MNKDQYLECLKNNLRNIPVEEVNNIIDYYMEYFEDAGVENEQIVIAELGKPELVASKICADYVIKDIESHNEPIKNVAQVKKGLSDIWIMILAICGFPIWFPLVIAVAAVVFSLVIAVFSVVVAFVIASIAIVGSGILALIVGICVLFIHMPTGLSTLGMACVAIGLGSLFLVATVWLGNLFKSFILKIAKIRVKKGVKNNEQAN
ncbi:DUF1700 domain-containing protein [[Clostridium] fimetarium]|uniref:Uncharacterized membrane protein n=1 Tax=[Clostridium] fimetarium TaxID=99656 RepID=A0A1I0PXY5_9FIRM|nr:DUF1700 domain-containing protein [[Clostridium] fimetarium]SEW19461.1 Uncharacterized membrane protein [[Clostridium] fimetarium]